MSEFIERPFINSWAISVLSSRTMWWNAANFVVALLSLTEIVVLIPSHYMPWQAAFVAAVNLWLRTTTQRPVAFIAPGKTEIVQVPKIDPGVSRPSES